MPEDEAKVSDATEAEDAAGQAEAGQVEAGGQGAAGAEVHAVQVWRGEKLLEPTRRTNEEKKIAYLQALAECGAARRAILRAQIAYQTVQAWRETDEQFALQEKESLEWLADELEELTTNVAKDLSNPASTTNRIFLLKALRPHKYRENSTVIAVENGNVKVDLF